ncbi:ATP-binding protein [Sphingomonas sp.]|uniref:ATP-binding protein n=1 Tax=Sphingomonas sp. TaxID=28214 RepID=UPI0035BBD778
MRLKRLRLRVPALLLLLSTAIAPGAAMAAPAPTYAAFDQSIAQTKKAMMGDPQHALASARAALALAERLPPSRRAHIAVATARWLNGEALIFMNQATDAAPITGSALRDVERFDRNSKLHGDLLRSRGSIEAAAGQVLAALRDYQRAYAVFRIAGEARSQAISLQDIGQIYCDAGDYTRALDYYRQSAEAFDIDPVLTLTGQNSRAEVLRKQKRYAEAAVAYRAALVQARKLDSGLLQTRILTNLAGSEADARRFRTAEVAIGQAMTLAQHGEAAGWRPFVLGVAAKLAFERGELAQARQLIGQTFAGVDLDHSELLFREYHRTAARIYEASGDERQAYAHLKAFQRLDSEAQALTASAASQLLAARFDFANQNLKISQLKESQLKRDVEARTLMFLGLLVAGGIVFALLLFGFFSIRRSRNKVRDANTTLSEVNGALEKALKAKTEFLATTSHEIRTPLNGILGMTQVLLADRRVQTDIRERIEVVHGAGETMRALVDDILDVAKMESGRLTVVREPTDLPKILHDVARLWSGHAEGKGLRLIVDIDAAPARILSDGGRLRQIVFNLMSNATKFTSAGEIALRARAEALGDGTETLVIAVADSGIGIAADQQAHIFEAFAQVDGGVTRQFGGTGLGLAICRSLAQALGGDISVRSVVGEGTTFEVRLPLERADADKAAEPGDDGASDLATASLLIVEADLAACGVLRMLLAAEVEDTEAAPGLDEALAHLARGAIDHVLADVGTIVEGLDGLRVLVAAADACGAQVTLLVTPGAPLSIAEVMMVGAAQIVVKPIGGDDLIHALQNLYGDDPETFVAPRFLAHEAA